MRQNVTATTRTRLSFPRSQFRKTEQRCEETGEYRTALRFARALLFGQKRHISPSTLHSSGGIKNVTAHHAGGKAPEAAASGNKVGKKAPTG